MSQHFKLEKFEQSNQPGDYLIIDSGIVFICPCGCGSSGILSTDVTSFPHWKIEQLSPLTLSPSIQKTTPCRWHGYLKEGNWVVV